MKIHCKDCYFGEEQDYTGQFYCHKLPFTKVSASWWCIEGVPKDSNETFIQLMEKCNTEEKMREYIREIIREEIKNE